MAQHDYVIANGTGAAVRSDLNNALAAIVSQNSGATAPSPTYAFQFWADTTAGVLKLRNSANSAWITLFQLDGEWTTLPVENGTAAAPSIYFKDSGTDTGFYSPGTDQVAISTGGTGRLFIDSSGRCGIGTSSPAGTLHLAATYPLLYLTDTDATGSARSAIGSPDGNLVYYANENNQTGGSHIFYRNGANESVRIDSSGRVGIGTASAGHKLDLLVGGGADGVNVYNNATGAAYYQLATTSRSYKIEATGSDLRFYDNTGSAERARIDSSGRWLLGTSSARSNIVSRTPFAQFESAVAAYSGISAVNNSIYGFDCSISLGTTRGSSVGSNTAVIANDGIGQILFSGADGTNLIPGAEIRAFVDGTPGTNDMPGRLVFSTTADGASTPTERMRITNSGFAKFSNTGSYKHAVTTSRYEFRSNQNDVTFNIVNSNASPSATSLGCNIYYDAASPNNTGCEFLYCEDSTALRASIRSNGGLANYSANNANLSDRNAKKDISPAAGTWDCIKEWEIVNYRYKDQPDDADLNLGVIAQQVAESCPEVITVFEEAKDDQPEKLGIKEQQMYWMAIKALQEAQVRIEALEAEVAALKAS